ncbi:hypothetical protein ACWEVO_19075, partial [Micromonospora sp. NPDC003776]
MAVLVDVDPERLIVRLTGADRFWAVSAGIQVPTAAVTGVQESPSNLSALRRRLRVDRPRSYFTMASGGLG